MSDQDIHSQMSLLGIRLDSRNMIKTDGLQVQLMQMLQLMAEFTLQFKEVDKRLEQNSAQIRELRYVMFFAILPVTPPTSVHQQNRRFFAHELVLPKPSLACPH